MLRRFLILVQQQDLNSVMLYISNLVLKIDNIKLEINNEV
jgi:hypothetical protein